MDYTVRQLDDSKWYVMRGNTPVSRGYTHKSTADHELVTEQLKEYRIVHTTEGMYSPQFRFNPHMPWSHMMHRTKNEYQMCKSLEEAQNWLQERDITVYDFVYEVIV